jgi:hypothetical protein
MAHVSLSYSSPASEDDDVDVVAAATAGRHHHALTAWPSQSGGESSSRPHPSDLSPPSRSLESTSPAPIALALGVHAHSPPALNSRASGATVTRAPSLRFCRAGEAARGRTLKFAASPSTGEVEERRRTLGKGAARGEALLSLQRDAARSIDEGTDDEAPYIDAVAAAPRGGRHVTLALPARSPRGAALRKRTCGSPAPTMLSQRERLRGMRGRAGGSPAPGVGGDEDGYLEDSETEEDSDEEEEETQSEEEEEEEEEDASEEGSEAESGGKSDEAEEIEMLDDIDDDDAKETDLGSEQLAFAADITSSPLAPPLHLSTSQLPSAFEDSAPSSPTYGNGDGEGELSLAQRTVTSRTSSFAPSTRLVRPGFTPQPMRSPTSPLGTIGQRRPSSRSPFASRMTPSVNQRSLSSGSATRAAPSAAACTLQAVAGLGAERPLSPGGGEDAWHRLRHALELSGMSEGEQTPSAPLATGTSNSGAGSKGNPFFSPRAVAAAYHRDGPERARSVPPPTAGVVSAPSSPTSHLLHRPLHLTLDADASTHSTDTENDSRPGLGASAFPPRPPPTLHFAPDTRRASSRSSTTTQTTNPPPPAPIRIARPAPSAQCRSDAELSGCAALKRTRLRRVATAQGSGGAALHDGDATLRLGEEAAAQGKPRRRRRRTADSELAFGWGKCRLGSPAPPPSATPAAHATLENRAGL